MPAQAFGLLLLLVTTLSSAAYAQVLGPDPNAPGSAEVEGENGQTEAVLAATVTYTGDTLYNLRGGLGAGAMYDGRLGLLLDSDLGKAIGWRGAIAHLSLQAIQGTGLPGDRVGALAVVSGIEAMPTVRLFNAWVQQQIGDHASLRIGQFTASQEFVVSATANLFVNSTFGWPASFATDLPSGGPSYPLAAPGVRLAVSPTKRATFLAAVFAGDPAGPGPGAPQSRDRFGLNGLRFANRAYLIFEWQQALGAGKNTPILKLGGWRHFGAFNDLQVNSQGRSLAAPGAGSPRHLLGNWSAYAVIDGQVWSDAAGVRKLNAFARGTISPSDRNQVDRYLDVGLSLTGILLERPKDQLGVAIDVARISPALADLAVQAAAYTGAPPPRPSRETAVELTYTAKLGKVVTLQPDVQYVLRPNGGLITPGGTTLLKSAAVVGVRTSLQF